MCWLPTLHAFRSPSTISCIPRYFRHCRLPGAKPAPVPSLQYFFAWVSQLDSQIASDAIHVTEKIGIFNLNFHLTSLWFDQDAMPGIFIVRYHVIHEPEWVSRCRNKAAPPYFVFDNTLSLCSFTLKHTISNLEWSERVKLKWRRRVLECWLGFLVESWWGPFESDVKMSTPFPLDELDVIQSIKTMCNPFDNSWNPIFNLFPFTQSKTEEHSDLGRRRNAFEIRLVLSRRISKVKRSVCFWVLKKITPFEPSKSLDSRWNYNEITVIWNWSSSSVVSAEKEAEVHGTFTVQLYKSFQTLPHSLFSPSFPQFWFGVFRDKGSGFNCSDCRKCAKKSTPTCLTNHQKSTSDIEGVPYITKSTTNRCWYLANDFHCLKLIECKHFIITRHYSVSYFENTSRTRLWSPRQLDMLSSLFYTSSIPSPFRRQENVSGVYGDTSHSGIPRGTHTIPTARYTTLKRMGELEAVWCR